MYLFCVPFAIPGFWPTIYSIVVLCLLSGELPPGPAGKRNFWSVFAGRAEQIKKNTAGREITSKRLIVGLFYDHDIFR